MVKPGKCSRSDSSGGNNARRSKKLSVYDFNPDDERVEKDSRKLLSRCKRRSPKVSISPLDKYSFLQCFVKDPDNDFEKEHLEIKDSDDESVCELVSPVSRSGIPEHELSSANPAIDHVNFPLSSLGARSCIRESINSVDRGSGQILANEHMFCVDSDDQQENRSHLPNEYHNPNFQDDCVIDVRSSSSSEHGGHDEAEGAEHCSSSPFNAQEAVVVVRPDLIIVRNKYFTSASLTFTRKFIKLESFNCPGTNSCAVFWSISDVIKIKSFWCKKLDTVLISLHLKPEVEEAETVNNVSDITELNFSVCDPHWCQIQDSIKSLDKIYKGAWKTVVKIDPLWSEFSPVQQKSGTSPEVCSSNCYTNFEDFIYPHEDPDAVSVSKKDIELLQPASFINDTIIDFYIKYLEQHLRPEEKHRFHFFNSFFFRKLADLDKEPLTACEGRSALQNVFRWTRKVNLFEKDYLFIPVNFSLHWSLIVICHPGEVAKFTDEELHESTKVPCILHMDSIGGSHKGLKNLFQRYLWEEWKERYKETSKSVTSNFLNLLYIPLTLPQQENSYDCGLFVLHYVERFLEQAPVHFNPYNSASSFLNKDWFPPAEASRRRDHVRNVLYRIGKSNSHEDPLTTDDNYSSRYPIELDTNNDNRRQLDTCHGRGDKTSSPRLRMGRLGRSRESDVVVVGGGDNSSRTLVDGTYQRFHEAIPVNLFCNTMSPIEEEEAAPIRSTVKAGSNKADTFLSRRILLPKINDVESSPESSSSSMSPIEISLDEENHSTSQVLLVVSDSEKSFKNESCSNGFDAYVVEDSLELDDRSPGGSRVLKYNESCEQEVESPYGAKAHVSETMASESEEGVMAKPVCVMNNKKGTLTRYLSKDLRL